MRPAALVEIDMEMVDSWLAIAAGTAVVVEEEMLPGCMWRVAVAAAVGKVQQKAPDSFDAVVSAVERD